MSASTASGSAFSFRRIIAPKISWWRGPVEVVRLQAHLEQHAVERLLGEQDRAEDRGLGLLVVRRDAARWRQAGRRRPPGHACGVTIVLMSAVTPSATSTVTMWVPVVWIGSVEQDPPLVEPHAARLADRVRDLLGGDGAEQPAVVARLVRDREHGLAQQRGLLLGLRLRLGRRALRRLDAALRLGDRRRRRGLRELARDEVVAQVARRDVDHGAALSERARLLGAGSPGPRDRLAVGHVREQAQLAGALDGACELRLVAAAGAGDARRADLALVADRAPERTRGPCSRRCRPSPGRTGTA